MYQEAGKDGGLLIGVDLQKDPAVIERAYNDAAGITAEFNLNILRRINNEFGANFDLSAFEHLAPYNEARGRIEMYLRSLRAQRVTIAGQCFQFRENERILTEHSHKYSIEGFRQLAARAGFSAERVWTDDRCWFSVQYFARC
jgi:uncharacterized SAM-dependent methyltransferase